MAIDTAVKRRAVATVAVPGVTFAVTPDATPGSFWRATVGHTYNPAAPSGSGQTPRESRYWTRGSMIDRNLGT